MGCRRQHALRTSVPPGHIAHDGLPRSSPPRPATHGSRRTEARISFLLPASLYHVSLSDVAPKSVKQNMLWKAAPVSYLRQRSFPLASPKQCPSWVRMTTFLMLVNCLSVALISAVTRASAPIPGEVRLRQNFTVAVPVCVTLPFLSSVNVKSGPPTGRGAEQFDGPLSRVLSSVKYPALRSERVGPAIKSWREKVPTAIVGD